MQQLELMPEVVAAEIAAINKKILDDYNKRVKTQHRKNRQHRISCGKKGTFNRRHLYTDRSGEREVIFHATKGYRSYRKT